jgi:lipoprotein-anchoring transpeptidase ErfK/SrfK
MNSVSRRTFLKIAGLSLGATAGGILPPEDQPPSYGLARSTAYNIAVYDSPDPQGKILRRLTRDQIVAVLEEIRGANGPVGNPRWLRLLDGFAHTAHLQRVRYELNPVEYEFPESGRLMELTVPYSQSRRTPSDQAPPLYRLYYQTVVWAVKTAVDPAGQPWYEILDERLGVRYYVRAEHLRAFTAEELAPIHPDVAPEAKRIEVDLTRQELTAYENNDPVLVTAISSGWLRKNPEPGEGRTFTPTGNYRVFKKMPSRHMGNGRLTASLDAYELPGVPFVSFFHLWGTALHGAYWHDDFGRPCSQGCINMRPEEARWMYFWSQPVVPNVPNPPGADGTPISLHD